MLAGEIIIEKRRSREFGSIQLCRADEALAAQLPDLGLPRMGETARAAFRAVIEFEQPPANGSMADCLALAEARGFCADPRDWLPGYESPGQHLSLYQPWVDWIAENGLMPFHEYNTLAIASWDRWKPKPLEAALRLSSLNRPWIADLVLNHSAAISASDRALVLRSLCFDQPHVVEEWQVPLIEHFVHDRSAKVREAAQNRLAGMELRKPPEYYAQALAPHLMVEHGRVSYAVRSEPHLVPFFREWRNTTFAALAQALGLTPVQLAHGGELDFLDSQFVSLAAGTGDVEVRTIIAQRVLATFEPSAIPFGLFRDLDAGLRQRMLEAQFKSPYWNSVQEFLGRECGFLTPDQMHRMSAFETIREWLARHLNDRITPVNPSNDPLRAVALSVGKEAAHEALDFAMAAGMKPDNPRLTMLRLNLAL